MSELTSNEIIKVLDRLIGMTEAVGETLFIVYRLRDIDKEDHSGNRENPEENAVFHTRAEAEARAKELNKEEAERFWRK